MKYNIAIKFTELPGGRYESQGPNSGEYFRENYLKPVYDYCLEKDEELTLNFDGGYGYAWSFLEEAFGGLVREGYDGKEMLRRMKFITKDDPSLEDVIVTFITEAEKSKTYCKVRQKKK